MAYLPDEVLISVLPPSFAPRGLSYTSQPPTKRSLERIRDALGIEIPDAFALIARECASYGGWFASIGEDFDNALHIISINAVFHASGLPQQYILFNHGHDGDCDVWDTSASKINGEFPIAYVSLNDDGTMEPPRITHTSFRAYIDQFCRLHALQCPVRALRTESEAYLGPVWRNICCLTTYGNGRETCSGRVGPRHNRSWSAVQWIVSQQAEPSSRTNSS